MVLKALNIFFLGKGGVGKSTSSALKAFHLAQNGAKVSLISLDPAHNLSDIFKMDISNKGIFLAKNLKLTQIDIQIWLDKYLKDIEKQLKHNYNYLMAFGLQNYLKIARYAPGIEEYALLMAYQYIQKQAMDFDYLIFDMPPTALSLKFLTLPNISLLWLRNLLDLRSKINQKKEIISKIKFGHKNIESDKVLAKLNNQIKDFEKIKQTFENKNRTLLCLVLNTDKLSFSESKLIVERLHDFDLSISDLYLNKMTPTFDDIEISKQFKADKLIKIPLFEEALIGKERLISCLKFINF